MCGIVGYLGCREAAPVLFEALRKLEYRGYDSYGFATSDGSRIWLDKSAGKISESEPKSIPGRIGIAHTRWATHGGVTDANAHPHSDCKGDIAVVHNGIIENYQELKKALIERGHKFKSDTDTEVIAHLIEEGLKEGSLVEAVSSAIKALEGSYALVAMHKGRNELVAARKESPLVIGVGDKEFFIASDIPAFLEHTKKVIYLHDKDIVLINSGIHISNLDGGPVERPVNTVAWDAEQAKKGEFEHYMLKEISEQAEVIKRAISQDSKEIMDIARQINEAKGIFFVACGTAAHSCTSASYFFSKVARKHINVVCGSEFPYHRHFITPKTLVIAVSQSGETADTLESIKVAKEAGARVISLVNVMGSSIMRESDQSLLLNAGPEIGVASTKAYTAMLVVLYLLAFAVAGKYEEGKKKLGDLYLSVYNLTSERMRERIKTLAESIKDDDHIFLLGRGLQYPTAKEAAHKIKEISYIHAEGFAGGELKHCELALIDQGTPAIFFVSPENEKAILSNASEVKSRGGFIIGVGSTKNDIFNYWIKTPEVGDLNPIVQIIPMQILAYELAVLRGNNPDMPRNLAKSVTVK